MARTTSELLAQVRRLLPEHYAAAEPLLSGHAAALSGAEEAVEAVQPLATIGEGEGKWLTLQAHGYGVLRASGESDGSLRKRLRSVEDQVTKPAIEAAVNAIIAPDECRIVEWWNAPFLDDESATGLWLDTQSAMLSGGPSSFLVVIPIRSTGFEFGEFLDGDLWLDNNAYLGEGVEDAAYAAIINEVSRMRAAGVWWRLVLET